MNDKIIFEEIIKFEESRKIYLIFIYKFFETDLTNVPTYEWLQLEKEIRKAHKIDEFTKIIGATSCENIETGNLFTADRTILKSIAFLTNGVSFGYLIKNKRWNRETEEINTKFIPWNDLESVSININSENDKDKKKLLK